MDENQVDDGPEAAAAEAGQAEVKTDVKNAKPAKDKAPKDKAPKDFVAPIFMVRSASQAGRRRSGVAFGPEPIEVDGSTLSPRELEALLSDPQLLVETQ